MENWRLNHLKELLQENPEDPFIRYAIAQEHLAAKDYDTAIEEFEKLRFSHPDYVGLYYHLGAAYENVDKTDQALKTYEEGIQVAEKLQDHHAKSELQSAKMNLELEL